MSIRLKTDFKGAPPRPFRHKNGVYYIRLTTHYRDIWRSCKTRVKREAEEYAYQMWYEYQHADVKTLLRPPGALISTEIESYKNTDNFKMLKNSTRGTRMGSAYAFLDYCDVHRVKMFDDLTPEFCEAFLATRGRTGKTFNNVRSDLIKIFENTARRLSVKNPFESVPQRLTSRGAGASRPKAAFTDEQVKAILEYITGSDKLKYADEWLKACKIAMYTGLRFEDIALLRYDEIMDDILEVTPKKTQTVTHKKIIMKLPPELQRDLFRVGDHESPYILPHLAENYPRYDESGELCSGIADPLKPFGRVLSRLHIMAPDGYSIGFHSFRVTLVTKLRQAGYSAEIIGGLVGHTNKLQTEHYNRAALSIDISRINYGELEKSVENL